jgi:hypothetical protein
VLLNQSTQQQQQQQQRATQTDTNSCLLCFAVIILSLFSVHDIERKTKLFLDLTQGQTLFKKKFEQYFDSASTFCITTP